MTIFKYPIAITDTQTVLLPFSAKILAVAFQGEKLCLWALVEPINTDQEARTIDIFGTGHPIDNKIRDYLGTVHTEGFVWHIFERR